MLQSRARQLAGPDDTPLRGASLALLRLPPRDLTLPRARGLLTVSAGFDVADHAIAACGREEGGRRRGAEISDGELLGRLMQYGVMVFVVLLAVDHLDIGGGLIQQTFLILLGGVVVALALAFGIGGRDRAAALIERWFPRDRGERLP